MPPPLLFMVLKAIYSEPPGSQSQWNAQTADILRNSVLLLMANDKTLLDLPGLAAGQRFPRHHVRNSGAP